MYSRAAKSMTQFNASITTVYTYLQNAHNLLTGKSYYTTIGICFQRDYFVVAVYMMEHFRRLGVPYPYDFSESRDYMIIRRPIGYVATW